MMLLIKKFFRQKSNYFLIILISICFAFSLTISSISNSIHAYWENTILNEIIFRTYELRDLPNVDEAKKILDNISEVEGYFPSSDYTVNTWVKGINSDKDLPVMSLYGIVGSQKVVVGEEITNDNKDENVLICPNKYLPYYSTELRDYDESKEIDLTRFLNKTISLVSHEESDNKQKTAHFKIIGLYEADNEYADPRACYTYYTNIEELRNLFETSKYEITSSSDHDLLFQIKNIVDEEKVLKELENNGLYATKIAGINTQIALKSLYSLISVKKVITISLILILIFITLYKEKINRSNLSINKLIGYNNKNIIKQTIFNNALLLFCSFIILIPLTHIYLQVFQYYLPLYDNNFKDVTFALAFSNLINIFFIIMFIMIILTVISFLSNHKSNILKDISS